MTTDADTDTIADTKAKQAGKPAERRARIRRLNDAVRSTFLGGQIVMTNGVQALSDSDLAELLECVRTFNDFGEDNDPHGEHDFGAIDLSGQKYFFKMDYYAPDMEGGSEDPSDPTKTARVLTIMRADEY